jgi:glyoxylase-like metal-dependent hydrolase (beta-lactamase superfamily II)
LVEILHGVHQVDGVNANSYLISESDGSLTLIDTGMSKDGKKILNYIQTNLSKKPSDLKTIIITHSHVDHIRGAYSIKKSTGAKLVIHTLDADYLSGEKKMPLPKGVMGFLFRILSPFFKSTPVKADQRVNEGDNVGRMVIVHTPGHTPGSISILDSQNRLIFVGDTIRYSKGKVEGPPKQFTPDLAEAHKSIVKISKLDFEILLGGHGDPLKEKGAQKVKELAASFQ